MVDWKYVYLLKSSVVLFSSLFLLGCSASENWFENLRDQKNGPSSEEDSEQSSESARHRESTAHRENSAASGSWKPVEAAGKDSPAHNRSDDRVSPQTQTKSVSRNDGDFIPSKLTYANRKLKEIAEEQKRFLLTLSIQSDEKINRNDLRRKGRELIREYEAYLSKNDKSVVGYILYGKLLRKVGELESANKAFMKANRLDPNIAVVKQQIGNYLAEKGIYEAALPYFLAAAELKPNEPLYHFQLGELIHTFYEGYVKDDLFEPGKLDEMMLNAFEKAASLAPQERTYGYRYAEAHYDVASADWEKVYSLWKKLYDTAGTDREKDILRLHLARVAYLKGDYTSAEEWVSPVDREVLGDSKRELMAMIREHHSNSAN